MYDRVLASFATTVALRDEGTGMHCERVAYNATVLARALKQVKTNYKSIYNSGMLHDLGKIAIPELILNKPGRLTGAEWTAMKMHADIGADLVDGISEDFNVIADGIRSHHERWDGAGYPRGLAGEQIPLAGRCIAVSDVFEAMTTERPYHGPLTPREGIEHLEGLAGSHLWPKAVECFAELYSERTVITSRDRHVPPVDLRQE